MGGLGAHQGFYSFIHLSILSIYLSIDLCVQPGSGRFCVQPGSGHMCAEPGSGHMGAVRYRMGEKEPHGGIWLEPIT